MASDVSTLTAGTAAVVCAAGAVSIGVSLWRRPRAYLPAGHALALPQDADPLPSVLRRGLAGLTVPVRPGPHGELFLGPGLPSPGRTLRRLVLAPLFARARARGGRLCRDQQVPFRLVVEFGGPSRDAETLLRAYRILDRQLRDHAALLSSFEDGVLEPGAITVAVAGIVDVRELLAGQRRRYAFADGSFDDLGTPAAPPALVPMISEPWRHRFGWDGRDTISAEERHLLHALIQAAHDEGRTVRMSGLSAGSRRARQAVWGELAAAGVDVIADTGQAALVKHLRRHPIQRPERRPVAGSPPAGRAPSPRPGKISTKPAAEVNRR